MFFALAWMLLQLNRFALIVSDFLHFCSRILNACLLRFTTFLVFFAIICFPEHSPRSTDRCSLMNFFGFFAPVMVVFSASSISRHFFVEVVEIGWWWLLFGSSSSSSTSCFVQETIQNQESVGKITCLVNRRNTWMGAETLKRTVTILCVFVPRRQDVEICFALLFLLRFLRHLALFCSFLIASLLCVFRSHCPHS